VPKSSGAELKHAPSPRAVGTDYAVRVARTVSEVEGLRSIWVHFQHHPNSDIDHYLAVLRSGVGIRPHVMVAYRGNEPEAMLVGRLERRAVEFKVGYLRLPSPRVRSLTFIHGGVLGSLSPQGSEALTREITSLLRGGEAVVAYFNSLRTDSSLFQSIKHARGFPSRDRFPKVHIHRAMAVPDTVDALYSKLSSKSRKNQRRQAKRLEQEHQDAVVIERFPGDLSFERMLADVEAIARKTYQRGLEVGFADTRDARIRLRAAADRGQLRTFVLYLGVRPVAFWMGTLHRASFYSDSMGYDPDCAEYSPGMYLIMKVIEGLACRQHGDDVRLVDFGLGDAQYKQVLGDREWQEASFFLFVPTAPGAALNLLRTPIAALDHLLRRVAGRAGLLYSTKKAWRERLRLKK
jgi:CelD/BcsL family acetyltransferase involved in cellulose biosynthesis